MSDENQEFAEDPIAKPIGNYARLRTFDEMEPAEQIKLLKAEVDSAHEHLRRLGSEIMALRWHQHGPTGQCLVPMRDRYIPNEGDW